MNTLETTVDTQLIEDYLHTTEIIVKLPENGPQASIAPYINHQGQSEALVITEDENGGSSLYQVVRESMSDSGWNYYGLGAQPNFMAVIDETHVWIYGTDNCFWIYRNGTWHQQANGHGFEVMADRAMVDPNAYFAFCPRMSASLDGIIWCLDRDGSLWCFDPTAKDAAWQEATLGQGNYAQAPVGKSDDFFVLNAEGKIYHFAENDPGSGNRISPMNKLASMMAMGSDGVLWALLYEGTSLGGPTTLYRYEGTNRNWTAIGNTPLDLISVADSQTMFGLASSTGNTYHGNQEQNLQIKAFEANTQTWTDISSQSVVGVYAEDGENKVVLQNMFGLVAVPGGTSFWYFDTLIKTYDSGSWKTVIMPTGMQGPMLKENQGNFTGNVRELAVGLDKRMPGVSRTFFLAGDYLFYSTYLEGQAWSFPSAIKGGRYNNLGLTNQQDDGSLILYAATDEGRLLTARQVNPALSTTWTLTGSLPNGTLQQAGSGEKALSIAITAKNANDWCVYANAESKLQMGFGTASDPPSLLGKFFGNDGSILVKEIIRLPVSTSTTEHFVIFLDNDNHVQVAWGFAQEGDGTSVNGKNSLISGQDTSLPYVKSCSGVLDENNLFRLYARGYNDQLWVLRQTSEAPSNNLPFGITPWHPLGDSCVYLADGPYILNDQDSSATTEVFLLDSDHFLQLVKQNKVTGIWESVPIHKPKSASEAPLYVSQYVTELTLTQAGSPAPAWGQKIQVSCKESVAIWHHGKQYNLAPGQPAELLSDRSGKISVNSLAFGIHTPCLTFSGEGFSPVTVYPSQHIHDRLSKVDQTTLQSAKKYTKGFQASPENLLKPGVANLSQATTLIQNTYKVQQDRKIGPGDFTGANLSSLNNADPSL